MAVNVGPGGRADEDILDDVLKKLVATQMAKDAPMGIPTGIWADSRMFWAEWGGRGWRWGRAPFYDFEITKIDFTFVTEGLSSLQFGINLERRCGI